MTSIESAIKEWKDLLFLDAVETDSAKLEGLLRNCGGMSREVPAILYPRNTEDVKNIVRVANKYKVSLYSISTGKNYGLGSRLPVQNGSVIVSLENMNKILKSDKENGNVLIQPGVTQKQVFDHLQNIESNYFLDVTGSGTETSIIGNWADGGDTYYSKRDIHDLEVVLGNGEVIRTGLGRYSNALAKHLGSYGAGPRINDLFRQSNLGIITSATVGLVPKGEYNCIMICSLENDSLFLDFFDRLGSLRRNGVLDSSVHIANNHRMEIYVKPMFYNYAKTKLGITGDANLMEFVENTFAKGSFGSWSAVTGIHGSKKYVSAVKSDIKNAMKDAAKVKFIGDGTLNFMKSFPSKTMKAVEYAMRPLYEITKGKPSNVSLHTVHWPLGHKPSEIDLDPEKCNCGQLYYLPIFPAKGGIARMVVDKISSTFLAHEDFVPYITLNMVTKDTFEGVVNLAFDRSNRDQACKARQCIDILTEKLAREGIYPCRVDIDSMSAVIDTKNPYWQFLSELKKAADPNDIISPGRYNL